MGAVAEHHVEQDRRDGGVVGLLVEHLDPGLWVDHRVRSAAGVLLLTEIEADVTARRRRSTRSDGSSGTLE